MLYSLNICSQSWDNPTSDLRYIKLQTRLRGALGIVVLELSLFKTNKVSVIDIVHVILLFSKFFFLYGLS